jgi:hypothetical protein
MAIIYKIIFFYLIQVSKQIKGIQKKKYILNVKFF